MSKFLTKIKEIENSESYIEFHKYHEGNIFSITKVSRWELLHSNFIAWALNPESSHDLKFFPMYEFMKTLGYVQENADNYHARKLPSPLLHKFYDDDFIVDVTIEREFKADDNIGSKIPKYGYIDLLIEITTNEKILPIIIEIKVHSPENGKKKDQTVSYYTWGENVAYNDRTIYFEPIYIFLYPDYNQTKQKSDQYIRMTFQELVDNVLAPSSIKCKDIISKNNYKLYMQSLSYLAEDEKGGNIMAISPEEKKILNKFLTENKQLLLEILQEDDELSPNIKAAIAKTIKKDYSKYKFMSYNDLGKGQLVLAVVKQYVIDNPDITFADLQQKFPDALQGNYGVVRVIGSVSDKDMGIGGKKRYFVKANEKILLNNGGVEVLVCSEWGIDNITPFIKHAQSLGYIIEKI